MREERGEAVVEEAEDEDAVHTLGEGQGDERPGRDDARADVHREDRGEVGDVEQDEDDLRGRDFAAGEASERGVQVHEAGGIHKRTGVAPELGVVALAGEVATDLVHVRAPVDLGVGHPPHDERAQRQLADAQRDGDGDGGADVVRIAEATECGTRHRRERAHPRRRRGHDRASEREGECDTE